jgi:hypothetical protein
VTRVSDPARGVVPGAPVVLIHTQSNTQHTALTGNDGAARFDGLENASWLQAYDAHYYDLRGARPLPVLRVQYADANRTWLYVDPTRGAIVQRTDDTRRLRRWLYQGLHSLDFPALYYKRPLWDIVVIGLSVGGLVLSATTLIPAWRRLKKNARGFARTAGASRRVSAPVKSPVG